MSKMYGCGVKRSKTLPGLLIHGVMLATNQLQNTHQKIWSLVVSCARVAERVVFVVDVHWLGDIKNTVSQKLAANLLAREGPGF